MSDDVHTCETCLGVRAVHLDIYNTCVVFVSLFLQDQALSSRGSSKVEEKKQVKGEAEVSVIIIHNK